MDNQFDYARSPSQREYFDWYQYGGITRPVTLHILPDEFLSSVQVETRDWRSGAIRVRARFGSAAPQPAP